MIHYLHMVNELVNQLENTHRTNSQILQETCGKSMGAVKTQVCLIRAFFFLKLS